MFIPHRHDAPLTTTDTTTEESDTNINQDNGIDISIFQSTNRAEDIANVRNQGFEVNDDNEPVPENIPTDGTSCDNDLKDGQTWGWDGIDRHHVIIPEKEEPSYQHGWSPLGLSHNDVFLAFLPLTFLLETVVYNTNNAIESLGEPPLGWAEFLCFLGLWCIMYTVSGFS